MIRVDSGGTDLRMDFTAVEAAVRTTSPLSMYKSKIMGKEGRRKGVYEGPQIVASELKATTADSRSAPEVLLVANDWRVSRTFPSLYDHYSVSREI